MNTRRTQPYRKQTGRGGTAALAAMLRGRTASGMNPMDIKRGAQKASRRHLAGMLRARR